MDSSLNLPFQVAAHDPMRNGLASLREDALPKHPVEQIQMEAPRRAEATKAQMLRDLYGVAVPAREQIERSILGRVERLPGLHSSKLGLEALSGTLDDFSFESYIGLPQDCELPGADMHSTMEQRLGMAPVTKPVTRGIF